MKLKILIALTYLIVLPSSVLGAGYLVSMQSTNAMSLTNAYIANTDGADSAYFNPAKMVWLKEESIIDTGLNYISHREIEFDGTVWGIPAAAESEPEETVLPFAHFVSPQFDNWRLGLSFTIPAGITKQWDSPLQMATAEESYLGVLEMNPSMAYMINNHLSIGGGLRFVYGETDMKAQLPAGVHPVLIQGYQQELEGDTWEVGYNLAMTFKPTDTLSIAGTYRSEIDLDIRGDGSGYTTNPLTGERYLFDGINGEVSLPMPAMISFGVSQVFRRTSVEIVYERTFWSAFDVSDISFNDPIVDVTLGAARDRNWNDTNSFRVGISYQASHELQLMGGISFEETPIPSRTFSFDLPESDMWWFSAGTTYTFNKNMEFGLAYSYGRYKDRTVAAADENIDGIVGEFSNISFYSIVLSLSYRFSI